MSGFVRFFTLQIIGINTLEIIRRHILRFKAFNILSHIFIYLTLK